MRTVLALILNALLISAGFAVEIGEAVPNVKVPGSDGKTWELQALKGKVVVLEWFNTGCPFVRKHYDGAGNMQALQAEFKDKVVWLTVATSAAGKQGHLGTAAAAKEMHDKEKMKSQAILMDGEKGELGKLFEAKTTPQIVIIDAAGKLAYNGAIDSIASSDAADIAKATPYAKNAIAAVLKGEAAPNAKNKPYGCGVKY